MADIRRKQARRIDVYYTSVMRAGQRKGDDTAEERQSCVVQLLTRYGNAPATTGDDTTDE